MNQLEKSKKNWRNWVQKTYNLLHWNIEIISDEEIYATLKGNEVKKTKSVHRFQKEGFNELSNLAPKEIELLCIGIEEGSESDKLKESKSKQFAFLYQDAAYEVDLDFEDERAYVVVYKEKEDMGFVTFEYEDIEPIKTFIDTIITFEKENNKDIRLQIITGEYSFNKL